MQSALLEVMAERHVSIGGKAFPMPDPFLVMATQNPINEGVYPLPEAQRDRFLFKLLVDYPVPDEEREIVYRMGVRPPEPGAADHRAGPAAAGRGDRVRPSRPGRLRRAAGVRHPHAGRHGLKDVAGWLSYGASPRASLGMIAASRALALVRGRDFVVPQDVVDVAADVLRHRLVLSYDALADGVPVEAVLTRLLQAIPLPQVSPYVHPGVA